MDQAFSDIASTLKKFTRKGFLYKIVAMVATALVAYFIYQQGTTSTRMFTDSDSDIKNKNSAIGSYDAACFFRWFAFGVLAYPAFELLGLIPFKFIEFWIDKILIGFIILGITVFCAYMIYALNAVALSSDPKKVALKTETVALALLGASLGVMTSFFTLKTISVVPVLQIVFIALCFISIIGVGSGVNALVLYFLTDKRSSEGLKWAIIMTIAMTFAVGGSILAIMFFPPI